TESISAGPAKAMFGPMRQLVEGGVVVGRQVGKQTFQGQLDEIERRTVVTSQVAGKVPDVCARCGDDFFGRFVVDYTVADGRVDTEFFDCLAFALVGIKNRVFLQ